MKNQGFALIEVIVSMAILSIVLASAVGLLYSVSVAVETNGDRLKATYLAQECLESFRNARDTAWKNYYKWDCAWNDESSCEREENFLKSLKGPVVIEGIETKFSRDFTIGEAKDKSLSEKKDDEISVSSNLLARDLDEFDSQKALIKCSVDWGDGSLSISEILTNWRKI